MKIEFTLSESDLEHFRLIMQQAQKSAARLSEQHIIESARALLDQVEASNAPDFISDRLQRLQTMTDMVRDSEWQLPAEETARVLSALAYFSEPEDLIPDHIPGLGFLDDAIMVELVAVELRHEVEAYDDFCAFRAEQLSASGTDVTRSEWLQSRREELQQRMRRRRKRRRDGSNRKSPFSLF